MTKRVTQAKVDRARDALTALKECEDFGQHFRNNTIDAALRSLVGIFPGHPHHRDPEHWSE